MFLASVAALSLASADSPCCEAAKECIERLRSVKSVAEPSRPLRRSCEADFLSKNGGKFVAELLQLLAHPAWETRDAAAVALASVKPVSKQTVTALHALARRDPHGWAGWALEQIGDPSSAAVMVELAARARSQNTVDDPLWSAMVPLAIEALPAAPWDGRIRLVEIIVAHPDRRRPASEAKRLHALLLAELAKPTWATPDCRGRAMWDESPRFAMARAFDECLPVAGALVAALERYGVDASMAARAIESAGSRNQYVEPFSRTALVKIGSQVARDRIAAELERPEPERVFMALEEALDVPEPGTLLDQIELVASRSPPELSSAAALVLSRRARLVAPQLLRKHLQSRRINVVVTTLWAIRELGPRVRELEPEVTPLLSSPSPAIRAAAAGALSTMINHVVIAPLPKCFEGAPLTALPREGPLASCGAGAACVRGQNDGEFGGDLRLELSDGGTRLLIDKINPLLVTEVGRTRVLVEGLGHMSIRRGSVWRFLETDAGVSVEFVTDTPGEPVGWLVRDEKLNLEVVSDDACRHLIAVDLEK